MRDLRKLRLDYSLWVIHAGYEGGKSWVEALRGGLRVKAATVYGLRVKLEQVEGEGPEAA